MGRAMSQLRIKEEYDRPNKHINRMGTIRDNVYQEIVTVYRPIFIYCVLIANLLAFVYTMYLANWTFASLQVNPLYGPDPSFLESIGALQPQAVLEGKQYWRLVTSFFLNSGLVSCVLNLVMLRQLGEGIEESFGFTITAVIYFGGGILSSVTSVVMNANLYHVGATGPMYALIGALFGDFLQNYHVMLDGKWMYLFSITLSLIIGLALGFLPYVDQWAQIGGLITGFLLGTILMTTTLHDRRGKKIVSWCSRFLILIASILLIAFIGGMGYCLFFGVNVDVYCPYCSYISCLNTPYWTCPTN